jgi:hypothetical protein
MHDTPRFRSSVLDHAKLRLDIRAAEFPAGFLLVRVRVRARRVEMKSTEELTGVVERNKVDFETMSLCPETPYLDTLERHSRDSPSSVTVITPPSPSRC